MRNTSLRTPISRLFAYPSSDVGLYVKWNVFVYVTAVMTSNCSLSLVRSRTTSQRFLRYANLFYLTSYLFRGAFLVYRIFAPPMASRSKGDSKVLSIRAGAILDLLSIQL